MKMQKFFTFRSSAGSFKNSVGILIIALFLTLGGIVAYSSQGRVSLSDITLEEIEKERKPLAWGRDPFLKPVVRKVKKEEVFIPEKELKKELTIKAIIFDGKTGVAIINDRLVKKGDMIFGRKVIDIQRDKVILEDPTGKTELTIGGFTTAKPAEGAAKPPGERQ